MKKQMKSTALYIIILGMLLISALPNLKIANASSNSLDTLNLVYAAPTVTMDKKSVKIGEILTNTFSGLSFDKITSGDQFQKLSSLSVDIYGQAGYYNREWTSMSQEFEAIIIPRSLAKDVSGNIRETDVKITISFVPNPGVSFDKPVDIVYLRTQFTEHTDQSITISKNEMQQFAQNNGYTLENISNINVSYSILDGAERMGALDVGDIIYQTKVAADKSLMRSTDSYTRTIFSTNPGGNSYYDPSITNYLFQANARFNTTDIQIEADKKQDLLPGDELEILFTLENNSSYLNNVIYFGLHDLEDAVELADIQDASTPTDFLPGTPWRQDIAIRNALFTTANAWLPLDNGDRVTVRLKLKIKEDYGGSKIRLQPFTYINGDFDGRSDGDIIELSILKHTLKFETNGGSSIDSQHIPHNHFASEPAAPIKEGYTFDGWFADEQWMVPWDFAADKVTADTTLYAKWTINTYRIYFESNGGTVIAPLNDVAFGTLLSQPTPPTREGHTFAGWYTDEQLTKSWDFAADTVTGNTTLYAKWILNTYDVYFESNGGTAITPLSDVAFGTLLSQPTLPTREGYTFAGWYTDKQLTKPWDFAADKVTADTTLYAKWIINTYNIYFETNGGTLIAPLNGIAFGSLLTQPNPPVKEGYLFGGWFTDEQLTKLWDFTGDKVTGTMTLYASWIKQGIIPPTLPEQPNHESYDKVDTKDRSDLELYLVAGAFSGGTMLYLFLKRKIKKS
ncbi:InlB B-repeat-containing protein [Beduini massiliensis]|uniref:InlB B-repeat-containing protein n=1 Tax=Beduini massiliensis TaxID=1585974 RepID=UPI00059A8B5A|nr:InlB B-repeat-containing protein [Beduini massiliensis]